jgi:uncharacterized membrane protein YhaH (DUF805 family)
VERGGRVIRIARNYLLPRGRIGRAQFIARTVLIWVAWGVLLTLVLSPLSFGVRSEKPATAAVIVAVVFFGLAALVFFWVISMQAAKRLHDFNHSGAWVFLGLIMVAWAGRLTSTATGSHPNDTTLLLGGLGLFALLVFGLILTLVPGNMGANRFGLAPVTTKATSIAGIVCACFVALFFSFFLVAFIAGVISGIKSTRHEQKPERDLYKARTERPADTALRSLQAFGASLEAWAKRPNCGQDKECVANEFALLERVARDADTYLGQSPVLWADLQQTKAAKGLSEEDIAKQTANFQKFDNAAVMVREFAKALNEFKNSRTAQEIEQRRKATVIARVKLDQAIKDFQLLPKE